MELVTSTVTPFQVIRELIALALLEGAAPRRRTGRCRARTARRRAGLTRRRRTGATGTDAPPARVPRVGRCSRRVTPRGSTQRGRAARRFRPRPRRGRTAVRVYP